MSKFLRVACKECGNEQIIFGSASNEVKCEKCNAVIAKPTGGKSVVNAKIIKVLD